MEDIDGHDSSYVDSDVSSCEDSSSSHDDSSSSNKGPEEKKAKLTTQVRFSVAQKACLNSYYSNGMTSTSKNHCLMISRAAKDADLTVAQVKERSLLIVHMQ